MLYVDDIICCRKNQSVPPVFMGLSSVALRKKAYAIRVAVHIDTFYYALIIHSCENHAM